jgi:hypothetical protein
MIYYKIRNKTNPELYHKGGVYNLWSKSGKTWSTLGKLRSMITMHMRNSHRGMDDWEIVEYEVREVAVRAPHEVMDAKKLVELLAK